MNYTRRLVESQVLNKPTHIYACALIPNNRSEKVVECGVKRTCLQDELRIQTWTLVLGVLLVGQGLNLSFVNTRICIRNPNETNGPRQRNSRTCQTGWYDVGHLHGLSNLPVNKWVRPKFSTCGCLTSPCRSYICRFWWTWDRIDKKRHASHSRSDRKEPRKLQGVVYVEFQHKWLPGSPWATSTNLSSAPGSLFLSGWYFLLSLL
jgi:hypothetical protein